MGRLTRSAFSRTGRHQAVIEPGPNRLEHPAALRGDDAPVGCALISVSVTGRGGLCGSTCQATAAFSASQRRERVLEQRAGRTTPGAGGAGSGEDGPVSTRRRRTKRTRPGGGGEGERQRAIAALEELYAGLPSLACRGLCGHSCSSHVDASVIERERVTAAGVDLDAPTADGACPALSTALVASGRCSVYAVRPMVCRLWGSAASMPCPHGCVPDGGVLNDQQALGALMSSLEVGGHRDAGVREVMEACLGDAGAAGLLAALLRGQREVKPALEARLRSLRAS